MFNLGHDITFWAVVVGAAVIRVLLSKYHSIIRSLATMAAAVFSAWVFTGLVLDILSLSPETYTLPIAALLALVGEGIMRTLISASQNPSEIGDLWRALRGKK